VWNIVAIWLGFSSAFHCQFFANFHQFSGLRSFSKKSTESMQIIWLSVAWTIWKERNYRIFKEKEDNLQALGERMKLQSKEASIINNSCVASFGYFVKNKSKM